MTNASRASYETGTIVDVVTSTHRSAEQGSATPVIALTQSRFRRSHSMQTVDDCDSRRPRFSSRRRCVKSTPATPFPTLIEDPKGLYHEKEARSTRISRDCRCRSRCAIDARGGHAIEKRSRRAFLDDESIASGVRSLAVVRRWRRRLVKGRVFRIWLLVVFRIGFRVDL